jgi:transposase-like protein
MTYFQETPGKRNRIERWFREMKNRTKMFYNNINTKTLKSLEELATALQQCTTSSDQDERR